MSFLFGHLYDAQCKFTHDQIMLRKTAAGVPESRATTPGKDVETLTNQTTRKRRRSVDEAMMNNLPPPTGETNGGTEGISVRPSAIASSARLKAQHDYPSSLSPHEYSEAWKRQAFDAASGESSADWNDITLISVSGHHQEREEEL